MEPKKKKVHILKSDCRIFESHIIHNYFIFFLFYYLEWIFFNSLSFLLVTTSICWITCNKDPKIIRIETSGFDNGASWSNFKHLLQILYYTEVVKDILKRVYFLLNQTKKNLDVK